jgi:hypothetical protein
MRPSLWRKPFTPVRCQLERCHLRNCGEAGSSALAGLRLADELCSAWTDECVRPYASRPSAGLTEVPSELEAIFCPLAQGILVCVFHMGGV